MSDPYREELPGSDGGLSDVWTDEDELRWAAREEARDAEVAESYRSAARPDWWMTPEDNAVSPVAADLERRSIDYEDGYMEGLGHWFLALFAGAAWGYLVRLMGEWMR